MRPRLNPERRFPMFLFHLTRFLSPLAAAVVLLLTTLPASAQLPRIAPDAHGFQATMLIQQAQQERIHQAAAPRPASPAVVSYAQSAPLLNVSVNVPNV